MERGYSGVSIRDIVAESHTNVAMVNYYFRTKHNLFEIVFEEALNVLTERISSIIISDTPFPEMIRSWIEAYYELLSEYPQIPIFVLTEINRHPEHMGRMMASHNLQAIFDTLSTRIEEEVERGTISPTSATDLGINILSLCVFPFVMGPLVTRVTRKSHEEYSRTLMSHKEYVKDFVTNAIKVG